MRAEIIVGPNNTVLAEILADHQPHEHTDVEASIWTVPEGASLCREGVHSVFRVPWIQARLVCRSDIARTVLARCFSSFQARSHHDRVIVRSAARYRLLVPATDGLPTAHVVEPKVAQWRNADVRFWSAFANEQDGTRGATRPYAEDRPLPARIETMLDQRSSSIGLEGGDNTPRAIPRSARGFESTPVAIDALGRWLARFMRHRQIHNVETTSHLEERTGRGFPEAGALGTTMLWVVSRRIERLPSGLWRYDADQHRLIPVNGRTGHLACEAIQADKPLKRGQGSTPAGIGIITVHMDRLAAQYDHLALYLAVQNAAICMTAATVAGVSEGIGIRIYGRTNGALFARETGIPAQREAPVAAFGFGTIRCGPNVRSLA